MKHYSITKLRNLVAQKKAALEAQGFRMSREWHLISENGSLKIAVGVRNRVGDEWNEHISL